MSEVVSALVTVAASSLSSVLTGTRASGFSSTVDVMHNNDVDYTLQNLIVLLVYFLP